ncbi:6-bladed beta-propeller [Ramlibacter monticola]|uniref:6-bladed beta-propeller n=1 Tax=Ramlibacter monticola TaxID=1926872 RepID=A0A937CTL5_9BURK|nr:6-bladed beta-propeller [Ramlibacter monticola]MBL0391728.1 6-bladed beta-propeller [Ramlibacter monticola]
MPLGSTNERRMLLLGLAGSGLLASCAVVPPEASRDQDQGDLLWPAPPEQPRFAYETALRNLGDITEPTEEEKLRARLTGVGRADGKALAKPSSIAAREGRIFVGDSIRRSILVFDVPRRKVFQFGLRPPGTLAKPTAIALDRGGKLYVADASLRKVFVYDRLGLHLQTIGQPGELHRPTGVAASPDGSLVYVIDRSDNESEQHRVMIYDAEGKLVRELGRRGRREGEFNLPVQAAVTGDGLLHVLDAGNFRVQTFDAEGKFLRSFGQVGTGLGQFARPRNLACDDDGRLYVTDGAFGNLQIFTPAGELLLAVGRGSRRDLPGCYGLISGVAVDETGRIYVADQLFSKVEVLRRLSDQEGRKLLQARG